jgi:uncharacterized protein YabE (DUF348 family)
LAFAAVAGLALLLAARPPLRVRLTVDGASRFVDTRAGSVADLLAMEGVTVGPHDRLTPGPDSRLAAGTRIVVDRGRPYRLRVDGRTVEAHSHGRTPRAVLADAGVTLGAGDAVQVNARPWPLDQPLRLVRRVVQLAGGPGRSVPSLAEGPIPESDESSVDVLAEGMALVLTVERALPVTLLEDGIPYTTNLAGATIGAALAAAGMPLVAGDEVLPSAESPLVAGQVIQLKRGTPFQLVVDGQTLSVRAHAETVGEAIRLAGIDIGPEDRPEPGPETPLAAGMEVTLVRVATAVHTEEAELPFGREQRADPEAELDSVTVVQAGAPGRVSRTVRTTTENGEVTGRVVLEETVLQAPVPEIVSYGTKVVWRTIDTEQGPKQYWRKLRAYATSYSLSRSGSNPNAPWYGRTRMGLQMRKGIIAVDPKVIPLGMWLYVPGYGVGIAGDTGGGVKRYHVDLGYDDDNYVGWHQYVDVYILDRLPPEHQMPWILP